MQLKGVDFRAVFYVSTKVRRSASDLMFCVKVILPSTPLQEEVFSNSSETDYCVSFVGFCFEVLRESAFHIVVV
jgi:hypothetical protein